MYRLSEYSGECRDTWNKYVLERGSIFHAIEWKEILEEIFGYDSIYYVVQDEYDKIVGIIPIIVGRCLNLKKVGVCTPFCNYLDICCENDEVLRFVFDSLSQIRQRHRLNHIELRLRRQFDFCKGITHSTRSFTFILPLVGGEETVMALSTRNNRNHTRKVYKNRSFLSSFSMEKLDDFYKVYSIRQKQLGSPAPGREFFHEIVKRLSSHVTLLTVMDSVAGSVVGGMFILGWKDTLYYMWGGTLIEYNRKYLNNFMYWEAVRYGIENGFSQLDLGRSPKDSGTYKFKEQFGAQPVQLQYLRFTPHNKSNGTDSRRRLKTFVELWKVMPNCITQGAGRYLIKYIMP